MELSCGPGIGSGSPFTSWVRGYRAIRSPLVAGNDNALAGDWRRCFGDYPPTRANLFGPFIGTSRLVTSKKKPKQPDGIPAVTESRGCQHQTHRGATAGKTAALVPIGFSTALEYSISKSDV